MAKTHSKSSSIVSIGLHLLLAIYLIIFSRPISILEPSRSDGIEVSLVSPPPQTEVTTPIKTVTPIKTLDAAADINLKASPLHKVAPPKPVVKAQPRPLPTPPLVHSQTTPKTKPSTKKIQINDLLGDALTSNAHTVRHGKALGGVITGTSNSNNLTSNYADQVIRAVRPFVAVPDNIDPKVSAIVRVEIYPNLAVKEIKLIKSSGNSAYDQNVQDAIMHVKIFPPLPSNANYLDYRILKLTFRPE